MNSRKQKRLLGLAAYALAIAGAVYLSWWVFSGADLAQADQLSVVIALFGSAGSLWCLSRGSEYAVDEAAKDLATRVRKAEEVALTRLQGNNIEPINLRFSFRVPSPDGDRVEEGSFREIEALYRSSPSHRMVITGAPGAGKTCLALRVVVRLLELREAGEQPRIPIRLSLAQWDPDHNERQTLGERFTNWLIHELVNVYSMRRDMAKKLLDEDRILPVLDGLDEMREGSASRVVEVLNTQAEGSRRAPVVLTCRSDPYRSLAALRGAARVRILPVHADLIREYIATRTDESDESDGEAERWRGVSQELASAPEGELARALSTPWRLTLAMSVYEARDRDPDTLLTKAAEGADAFRDHLLGLFTGATMDTQAQGATQPYRKDDVRRALTVLATYLEDNARSERRVGGLALSGSELVLHELWPLAGTRGPRIVSALVVGVAGLAAAAAAFVQGSGEFTWFHLLGWLGLAAFLAYVVWRAIWPQPNRLDPGSLLTREGLLLMAAGIGGGVVAVLVGVPEAGVTVLVVAGVASIRAGGRSGLTVDPRAAMRLDLAYGLVTGLGFGAAFGLAAGLTPGRTVAGAAFGLLAGVAVGVPFGWKTGFGVAVSAFFAYDSVNGVWGGLAVGAMAGLMGGLVATCVSVRYLALLAWTRRADRWLPWRLGPFLDWCAEIGLLRVVGEAYQFRHREFQQYLASHGRG